MTCWHRAVYRIEVRDTDTNTVTVAACPRCGARTHE